MMVSDRSSTEKKKLQESDQAKSFLDFYRSKKRNAKVRFSFVVSENKFTPLHRKLIFFGQFVMDIVTDLFVSFIEKNEISPLTYTR